MEPAGLRACDNPRDSPRDRGDLSQAIFADFTQGGTYPPIREMSEEVVVGEEGRGRDVAAVLGRLDFPETERMLPG